MTTEFFFTITKYKNLRIPTNINFEYAIPTKMKVINTIVNHFKYDVLYFEETFRRNFRRIQSQQYRMLLKRLKV